MKNEKDFIDRIPKGTKIAFFGAGVVAKFLKDYICTHRPDIDIICFIDTYTSGYIDGIKIFDIIDIEDIKSKFNLLIFTTNKDLNDTTAFFSSFGIQYLTIPETVEKYCRNPIQVSKMYNNANIFNYEDDKKLYEILAKLRLDGNPFEIAKYADNKHGIKMFGYTRNYTKQYLEYINFDSIKTVLDAGVFNGIQIFSYMNKFKNLKKIYGFEPLYDKFMNSKYDYFFKKNLNLTIIDKGLWDSKCKISFVETAKDNSASYIKSQRENRQLDSIDNIIEIQTTTIDLFKEENKIKQIDFIKMDIEGSELQALRGSINTILSDRPQLAISIYHSLKDFIEIPEFINNLLKDQNYTFRLGHYSPRIVETVFYAIPNELKKV